MPNRKNYYADKEKYAKTCRKQDLRYYAKTALYAPREWTLEEDELVLAHQMTDTELSAKIKRSVMSIQVRRSKLRKAKKENEGVT